MIMYNTIIIGVRIGKKRRMYHPMLKKINEKLKSPRVWYCVGIALVAAAGVILALTLYQSDEERPPAIHYGQEEVIVTAPPELTIPIGGTAPTETEPVVIEPIVTEPIVTDPAATEPQVTDPTGAEPDTSGPNVTEPDVTQPQVTEPVGPNDPEKPDQTENPGIPPEQGETPQVTVPQKQELTVERIASFSGAYVEDGSDEPVQNVASILVTNETESFLDLGTLTYDIDGKEASFIVTGLPAGASAWVMEAGRITVTKDSVFTQKSCETAFRQDAVTLTEDVTIQSSGNMLKVQNSSDEALQNIAVYYKAVHTDGNYFGGITYMSVIGDLIPGESTEKLAGHFREGWTNVVRVSYQNVVPST